MTPAALQPARGGGAWAHGLAMVAGETSGDMLAATLLAGLAGTQPPVRSFGIGGAGMVGQGFDAWWPAHKLAVRGYVEVLRHYREIVAIRAELKRRLLASPPSVFVGVDAPDFNLALERDLKAHGVPTVQFVCPAIWAWRPERGKELPRCVDHVLCIFPFEPALLAEHGVPATYVGHPLAPHIPMNPDRHAARAALGLSPDAPVVALLPGSRQAELDQLGRCFLAAARLIQDALPGVEFVLPAVPHLKAQVDALCAAHAKSPKVRVVTGQSHAALAACDVTLIASGTATLEAALFKRPMVVAYRMNWLSWQITRRKKLQPWVALPNILCQEFVVPELLQEAATPQALAREVLAWFSQPQRVAQVQERFRGLHSELTRDTVGLSLGVLNRLAQPVEKVA